jgi:hypothetical protein
MTVMESMMGISFWPLDCYLFVVTMMGIFIVLGFMIILVNGIYDPVLARHQLKGWSMVSLCILVWPVSLVALIGLGIYRIVKG